MTASSDLLIERFKKAICQKLKEVSGINEVFYEHSRMAGYPRVRYIATVWTSDSALKGTLSCTVADNKESSTEVDRIANTLLRELEGFSFCADDLMYYLHSGRVSPLEEADKTVRQRLVTLEFYAMGG